MSAGKQVGLQGPAIVVPVDAQGLRWLWCRTIVRTRGMAILAM
jgi:hypothetical protein